MVSIYTVAQYKPTKTTCNESEVGNVLVVKEKLKGTSKAWLDSVPSPYWPNLGTSAMEFMDITETSSHYLYNLMPQVEETVFLAVLSSDEVVYIKKIDSHQSVRTTAQPGNKKPLYCTGLGKTFLAFMPDEERERIVNQTDMKSFTNKTIVDKNVLRKKLIQYRSLGYSIDDEEGLYCLAAPIFGIDNELVAAISVAGPKERVCMKKDNILKQIKHTSLIISKDMGYRDERD